MKYNLLFAVIFLSGFVKAQDSQLGTTRSEDLQIKARMEYERRSKKQPQSHTTQTQNKAQESAAQKPADVTLPPAGTPVAPATASVSQKNVTCKNGAEIRELYVEYKGQGCELFYTKSGVTKSQARQNFGKSVCESVFEQMKSTVEKSGYVCEQKTN